MTPSATTWKSSPLERAGDGLVSHNLIVALGTISAGLLGVAFQALVSHQLRPEDYGAVFATVSLLTFLTLPAGSLTLLMARQTSRDRATGSWEASATLLSRGNVTLLVIGAALGILIAVLATALGGLLKIPYGLLLVSAPGLPFALALPLLVGAVQGEQRFVAYSALLTGQAGIKLAAAVALGRLWGPLGVLAGVTVGTVATYILAAAYLQRHLLTTASVAWLAAALRYLALVAPSSLALGVLLNADVLIVKHFFSAGTAGEYGVVAAIGRAIFWGASGVAAVMFPKVVFRRSQTQTTSLLVKISLGVVAIGSLFGIGVLSLSAPGLISIFAGPAYVAGATYLPWYAFGMTLLGGIAVMIAAHQARGEAAFLLVLLPLTALEPAALVAVHNSVLLVVQILDGSLAVILVGLVLVYAHQERAPLGVTANAIGVHETASPALVPDQTIGSENSGESDSQGPARMRILILSWRCPDHPRAGGAERFTLELARHLVALGHSVEWFASSFAGALPSETVDSVRVVRAGSWWSVYIHAFLRYRRSGRRQFDVVVDEVNVLPFFASAWSGLPTYSLIFQLHRDVWWYQAAKPLAAVGYVLEPVYMRACRRGPALTISTSTATDLRRLGFSGAITILPIGLERMAQSDATKADPPAFAYVGRLVPAKRVEHVLTAFAQFRRQTGGGVLWLVGTGPEPYVRRLSKVASDLGVREAVKFWGHVDLNEKHRLMSEARALLMTSVREGWGLVVTEANACGTPALVYDVPGLRDAVRHETTGLVVAPKPEALCEAMLRITQDTALYERLAVEARRWSERFSYEDTARAFGRTLSGVKPA